MDFRTRNISFKEKMKAVYGELNNFNVKKNKLKLTKNRINPISKKNEERIKLFEKVINSPMKQNNKYQKNIIYLIEETKRNNLGYKSFLDIEKDENSEHLVLNRFYRPNKFMRSYRSANSSFNLDNKLENLSRNSSKRDTLKKEIITELELNKKKYSTGSTYFSSNKSFQNFDNLNISSKLY